MVQKGCTTKKKNSVSGEIETAEIWSIPKIFVFPCYLSIYLSLEATQMYGIALTVRILIGMDQMWCVSVIAFIVPSA